MNPVLRLALASVLVASLAACGGFSSGLPGNTPLRDLTDDQAEQFCEAVNDYFDNRVDEARSRRVGCYVSGILAAAFAMENPEEACATAQQECLDADDEDEADCEGVTAPACDATVSDLETCIEDSVAANNEYLRALDDRLNYECDEASLEAAGEAFDEIEFDEPESCEAVDATCDE